jgi:hypothetical protein
MMFAFAVVLAGMAAFGQEWATGGLTATLEDGTLTISGEGDMPDYYISTIPEEPATIPWYGSRNKITRVVIESGVTSIGQNAFTECKAVTSVTIPGTVTKIGNMAFWYCTSLTSIEIPSSVTSIGSSVFTDCPNLAAINVDPENTQYISADDILYSKAIDTLIKCPGGKIGAVAIPGSVVSIGTGAFWGCAGITSVTIPSSVTSMGDFAFRGCSGLESIVIPNGVTVIPEYAFLECAALKSVTIPGNVTSIKGYAFYLCTGLTSVTVLAPNPPTAAGNSFGSVNIANISLYVPQNSINAYNGADIWKNFNVVALPTAPVSHIRAVGSRAVPQVSVRRRTLTVSNLQSSSAPIQLRVLDLRGRTVSSFSATQGDVGAFSLSKIPAGKYLVELRRSGVRLGTMSVMVR